MAQSVFGSVAQPVSIPVVPVREILPYAIFGGLLLLLAIYFVGSGTLCNLVRARSARGRVLRPAWRDRSLDASDREARSAVC